MDKIAISDVDGTLLKGSLVLNHACYLHDNGIVDLGVLPTRWKRSQKNEERIAELAEAYKAAIVGKNLEQLHTKSFVKNLVKDSSKFYSAHDRLVQMKNQGWTVYLISGSPNYLLTPFARAFGFRSKGSLYELDKNKIVTGRVTGMFGANAKRKHLSSLKIHDTAKVVAFGDTASDIPLFERAGYSVLVAPTKKTLSKVQKVDEILRK